MIEIIIAFIVGIIVARYHLYKKIYKAWWSMHHSHSAEQMKIINKFLDKV